MAVVRCRRTNREYCLLLTAVFCVVALKHFQPTTTQIWTKEEGLTQKKFSLMELSPNKESKVAYFDDGPALRGPSAIPEDDKTMYGIQKERRARIKDYCRSQAINETIMGKELIDFMVDEKHELLYCAVYKVSSTQLKQLMARFTNRTFQWLNNYSDKERRRVLKTHFKFMFVREPLERLLSAFIDKMYVVRDPMYRRMWGRPILKRYRPNATAEAIENCDDITFEEFVRYVADGGWDPHWARYFRWCKVCAVDYDFIGRFENLQVELPYVFRWAPGVRELPSFTRPYETHNTTAKVIKYYSQIPKKLLLRLFQLYRPDYAVFGYPYPGPIFEQLLKTQY